MPSHGDCPKCDVTDVGFELPDTRATFYLPEDDENLDENLEQLEITISINRVWKQCAICHSGMDFDVEWIVTGPDGRCWNVPSQNAAYKLIETEWPEAEEDHDTAYESERWLRRAEGWC